MLLSTLLVALLVAPAIASGDGLPFDKPAGTIVRVWKPIDQILAAYSVFDANEAEQHAEHAAEVGVTLYANPGRLIPRSWARQLAAGDGAAPSLRTLVAFSSARLEGLPAAHIVELVEGHYVARLAVFEDDRVLVMSAVDATSERLQRAADTVAQSLDLPDALTGSTEMARLFRHSQAYGAHVASVESDTHGTLTPGHRSKTYSAPQTSAGYRLPWGNGATRSVVQGWNGAYSHTGSMRYAYDFGLAEGEEVRASRGGSVAHSTGSYTACGGEALANYANRVVINHNDGTSTLYLHLQSTSVSGGSVAQGARVGASGKTGWTGCNPHLHFQRQAQGIWFTQSQTVYFDEYPGQDPRAFD